MKVMLLAWETPGDFAIRETKDEKYKTYMGKWYAYSEILKTKSDIIAGGALDDPSTATTVTVRNGVRTVEDGPYPDTKEQLGGFFIVEAADMDEAADLARDCPSAETGFVDARPIANHSAGDDA